MTSRYASSTNSTPSKTTSQNNADILNLLEGQVSSAGKAIEQTISLSAITSIVVGGAITAVVWFFINRYLAEKYPINEKQGKKK
ncbi:MAG: hypothetical protein M1542_08545 [Thermotogae bacterium]|jgi:hypothetical protein|nr:hypothetical protein [Thermotogota bacterium]